MELNGQGPFTQILALDTTTLRCLNYIVIQNAVRLQVARNICYATPMLTISFLQTSFLTRV